MQHACTYTQQYFNCNIVVIACTVQYSPLKDGFTGTEAVWRLLTQVWVQDKASVNVVQQLAYVSKPDIAALMYMALYADMI